MFSGAGCLPMSMPQSAWPALHLQVSVTDWSPLRTGGFTTSIIYEASIQNVNIYREVNGEQVKPVAASPGMVPLEKTRRTWLGTAHGYRKSIHLRGEPNVTSPHLRAMQKSLPSANAYPLR